MVKTGGRVFATPGAALLPQQVQIAPLHQAPCRSGPGEWSGRADHAFSSRDRPNVCVAEQSRRNDAIGRAGKARIERTKRKTKAVSSLPRQSIRRTAVPSAGN